MSRNSKNARLVRERNERKRAKAVGHSIIRLAPNGPKQTTPKHSGNGIWHKKVGARPSLWSLTKEVKGGKRA